MTPQHDNRFREPNIAASCQIPLCCMENCHIRKCPDTDEQKYRSYEVDNKKHLSKIDPYWADFLKAQVKSTANYLYSINVYGNAKDPTLKRRKAFSPDLIRQRLNRMPVVGGLTKSDMFLMLSIILNLSLLRSTKQKEYMQRLQQQGILTLDMLQYMQLVSHHPNTGLNEAAKAGFQNLCKELIQNASQDFICDLNYFNPDHIFSKSLTKMMDPYELEYLRNILECREVLSSSQFMYLVKLVERLQEMKCARRNEYVKILYENSILPSDKFSYLIKFLKAHSRTIDRKRLRNCFYSLEDLMELGPCSPRPLDDDDNNEEYDFMNLKGKAKALAQAKEAAAKKDAEEAAQMAAKLVVMAAAEEANKKSAERAAEQAAKVAAIVAARKAAAEEARKMAAEAAKKLAEELRLAAKEKRMAEKERMLAEKEAQQKAAEKAAEEAAQKQAEAVKTTDKAVTQKLKSGEGKTTNADGGKKDKKGKEKPGKGKGKEKSPPVVEPPVVEEEPQPDKLEDECVRHIRYTTYPLCQARRCPPSRPANRCPDPDTSFTCLCPIRRPPRDVLQKEGVRRMYAYDGTVLTFPKIS